MAEKDPGIDAYIASAAPFAQKILKHLRKLVHSGCSEVEETIKWSMPHFQRHGILCWMAGFKHHCAFGFWKAPSIFDPDPQLESAAMGNFGRITELADLPPDHVLIGYVRKAAMLNESGLRVGSRERRTAKPRSGVVPDDFAQPLAKNKKGATDAVSTGLTSAQATLRTHKRRDSARGPRHHVHE